MGQQKEWSDRNRNRLPQIKGIPQAKIKQQNRNGLPELKRIPDARIEG